MKWAFWVAAGLISYAYLGYPLWLWVRCRLRPTPLMRAPFRGSISILMVVRNEAAALPRKLDNLLELEYPSEDWEIVVVSDGSTDATNEILRQYA